MLEFTEAFKYLKDNTEKFELKYTANGCNSYWTCLVYISNEKLGDFYDIQFGNCLDERYESDDKCILESMKFAVIDTQNKLQIAVSDLAARNLPTQKNIIEIFEELMSRGIYKKSEVIKALSAAWGPLDKKWLNLHLKPMILHLEDQAGKSKGKLDAFIKEHNKTSAMIVLYPLLKKESAEKDISLDERYTQLKTEYDTAHLEAIKDGTAALFPNCFNWITARLKDTTDNTKREE